MVGTNRDLGEQLIESTDLSLDRLGVTSGDEVSILTDTGTETDVWRAFFDRAIARGASPTVVLMTTRSANGLEPTPGAAKAVAEANVVLALTNASATHTKALKNAAVGGAKVCSLPGISTDIMTAAVMRPDYEEMQSLADRLSEIFAPAREMRITTAAGTDLRIGMGGWERMPMADDGSFWPGMIANLPAGEVLIVPWEGDSDGVAVIDLAVSCYPHPLEEPVRIRFSQGSVSEVDGASEPAQRVIDLLAENGSTAGNNAEVALGINPHARNTGVLIETEKQFGTSHIGIGNSSNLGGKVWAPIHIDVIFDRPIVSVDGREILRDLVFNGEVLAKESYRSTAPLSRPALRQCDAFVEDGQLFTRWNDIQGRERVSQVGDPETAMRAAQVYARLRQGEDSLDADAQQVAGVMALYGVVDG
jgi:leucyl aminopeptidase (aminopeptidase T)